MKNAIQLLQERKALLRKKIASFREAPEGDARREWLRKNIGDAEVYLSEEFRFVNSVLKDLE